MNPMLLMQLGALAGALSAADRAGIFEALVRPAGAEELADRLELDPAGTSLVLEVLRTHGLLHREGNGQYQVSDEVARELSGPFGAPGMTTGFWAQVEGLLRGERPPHYSTDERDRGYSVVVAYLERMFTPMARTLAAFLAPLLVRREQPRLLDVGAGSGVWSLELTEQCPGARVTALDLPRVAAGFEQRARERGLGARADVITGDYFEVELPPAAFDVVMVANVLHLERAPRAAELVRRLRPALKPDGLLVVVDMFGDGTTEGDRLRSAYAVHLTLRMAQGRAHPGDEVRAWLRESGLELCHQLDVSPLPGVAALVATSSSESIIQLAQVETELVQASARPERSQRGLSELELLELRLARVERHRRHIWEQGTEPMAVILRTNLGLLHGNPAFVRLFGNIGLQLPPDSAVPTAALEIPPFAELVAPEDRQRINEVLRAVAAGGTPPDNPYHLRMLGRGGRQLECELSLLYPPSNNAILASIRDVTEQVRAARQIQRYAEELEQANLQLRETQAEVVRQSKLVALARLVAGVTHEVNTPLGSLRSGADTMRRAAGLIRAALPGAEGKLKRAFVALDDSVAAVDQASARISQVVAALKRFARLDEAPVQQVDLNAAVDSVVDLLAPALPEGVQIDRDLGQLPAVTCRADEINHVLMNLLLNAFDAVGDRGRVSVTTRAGEGQVSITVADTGEGIAPDELDQIFDPGYTTRGVGVGVGLGLPIAARIVDEHRGTIEVRSVQGAGTTFAVNLPTG